MKRVFTSEGDLQAADDVKSIVGQKDSPLKTDADFAAQLQNPRMHEIIERYRTEFMPLAESLFRTAQGIDPGEDINSHTQIPGLAFSIKGVKEGVAAKRHSDSNRSRAWQSQECPLEQARPVH